MNIDKPRDFRSCLMIDLGRETDGNGFCLGAHFALCINLGSLFFDISL